MRLNPIKERDDLLTAEQFAKRVGYTADTVRRKASAGEITACKISGCWGIAPEAVKEFQARSPTGRLGLLQAVVGDDIDISGFLDLLGPREQLAVEHYYGLNGKDPKTFEEVGEEMGLSKPGANMLVGRSINKISSRISSVGEIDKLRQQNEKLLRENANFKRWREASNGDIFDKPVADLDLSVRTYNCLRAVNIKTVGELVRREENEMLKFRNFGRKSLQELVDILDVYDLRFGMNRKDSNPTE